MRIIAGEFRSRKLNTLPGNNTRPTLDKVKEAVFSSLGGSFVEGDVLDLFAGSGHHLRSRADSCSHPEPDPAGGKCSGPPPQWRFGSGQLRR